MEYKFLDATEVPDYVASRRELAPLIESQNIQSETEVGDGNLNLVFIVLDKEGKSIVVKQALPYVRLVGPSWPMTPTRAEKEAESLRIHGELNPELVPKVYLFDRERYIIVMENLSTFQVWRGALIKGLRHEGVGFQMGQYVGELAFGTSVLGMDSEEQKILMAKSINPALCKITEDLVFTEAHFDIGRNEVIEANQPDALEHARDVDMLTAMGEAKWKFMTNAEALIHGDLHTGSVMVSAISGNEGPSKAKSFDSEFAFYGPVAFDIGALWANYVLAGARAIAMGDDDFAKWIISEVSKTWLGFEKTVRDRVRDLATDKLWTEPMVESLIKSWQQDAWLFAAAKMSRRIVGLAKAKDIETLEPSLREGAARGVLRLSRQLVKQRFTSSHPERFELLAFETLKANQTGK
jgi:5-methylthioribose kinase